MERSRQWAIRCVHEAEHSERSSFITLTYETPPPGGSLHYPHFQSFMMRLRERVSYRDPGQKLRYLMCGEYGEKRLRPHYHACLFGWDFPDREFLKRDREHDVFTSELLRDAWGHGHVVIGGMTFESAAYVARYCTKKLTGPRALEYLDISPITGEIINERVPEFGHASKRPPIGGEWAKRWFYECYKNDAVILRGLKMKPPKAYDRIFEKETAKVFDEVFEREIAPAYRKVKVRRRTLAKRVEANGIAERLLVREELQMLKFEQLKRGYENEAGGVRDL